MKTPAQMQQKNNSASRPSRPPRRTECLPVVVAHVMSTLPDSVAEREGVLRALAACIPPGDRAGVWVRTMQFHLEEHQRLCLDWTHAPEEA
jgi:hypothetical protein